jgi:hypothetical protein
MMSKSWEGMLSAILAENEVRVFAALAERRIEPS